MLKRIPCLAIILMTGVSLGTARRCLGFLLPPGGLCPEASSGTGGDNTPVAESSAAPPQKLKDMDERRRCNRYAYAARESRFDLEALLCSAGQLAYCRSWGLGNRGSNCYLRHTGTIAG